MPTREQILAFLADNPDRASRREIARAFGIKGAARPALKELLLEMQRDGLIERGRKRIVRTGSLPHVAVLDIFGRDQDGGLLARPVEWSDPSGEAAPTVRIRQPRQANGRAPVAGVGMRVLARTFPSDHDGGPAYAARIMKILERRPERVLGILRKGLDGGWRMEPVDRRQPEILLASDQVGEANPGDLIEVEPAPGSRRGLPSGRVMAVIGSVASEKAISMIALHAHEIPHVFPAEVLQEAEAVQPVGPENREDWRDLGLITIDPEDARDHDDAVFAFADDDPANPGGYVVIVAIADVAAYVRPGSAMDREALRRGNSVYFPDRVVPMLPERISNDLCSLREGEDRPALAVRMRFSADGNRLEHRFHRILMRSRARLSYSQAQNAVDGSPDGKTRPLLEPVLEPLWSAYRALARGRRAREPLELDLPERKILLHPDGTVDRVVVPERLESHRLIEEFMIQANVAAAESLESARQKLLYRVHDAPSLAKQEALRDFLRTLGHSLARGAELTPKRFNAILRNFAGTEHEQLVNEVVLRTQSQAEYSPYNIGHFGLSLRRYAHFTSPIRRYADLIVHRALIRAFRLGEDGLRPEEEARLEEIAGLVSTAERRAMVAERETIDRLIALHLAERIGDRFEGRIAGVSRAGLFVRLQQIGADGFVPLSTLRDDYYVHDEAGHMLTGRSSGRGYRLGDVVEVRLAEVAPMAGAMQFEMLSEPRPLPQAVRSWHKSRGGKAARGRTGRTRS